MSQSRFKKSTEFLKRAEQTIPLGSQTFSKSKVSYPVGVSPLFIERGEGCYVWDLDDNKYIDFVSGLLSVSLGYNDEDVNNAVIKQLQSGVTFSLPHRLEAEVAEKLVELIPCAEMVRFGKNGSDATSAAIRLARAYTQREHVAVCGYHGWQDWYIGSTTRDLGVPEATKSLTHQFNYNDIASLERLFEDFPEQISAVILEPMNVAYPEPNFLAEVKSLCHANGAVLIFDETITGFRFSLGGAQQLFGVTPDLATFGKGMANGYPLSAVVGKRDIMMLMEDIFFSGTFAGETLSLAATHAVLTKLAKNSVIEHITSVGTRLIDGLNKLISEHRWETKFSVSGHPSWSFLHINQGDCLSSLELKSLLLQEASRHGILLGGGHNINYAHQNKHIDQLLDFYKKTLPLLVEVDKENSFAEHFKGSPLQPVFKVR